VDHFNIIVHGIRFQKTPIIQLSFFLFWFPDSGSLHFCSSFILTFGKGIEAADAAHYWHFLTVFQIKKCGHVVPEGDSVDETCPLQPAVLIAKTAGDGRS
jgi:hypothetical protein